MNWEQKKVTHQNNYTMITYITTSDLKLAFCNRSYQLCMYSSSTEFKDKNASKSVTVVWRQSIHYVSCLMTKPTKWHVRPVKTQISLGICPVWSESSLSAWRKLGSLATHCAHSEDSDHTGQMPRLIWLFAGHICLFVGFVVRWLVVWPGYSLKQSHKLTAK